jgi:hypothetical protein
MLGVVGHLAWIVFLLVAVVASCCFLLRVDFFIVNLDTRKWSKSILEIKLTVLAVPASGRLVEIVEFFIVINRVGVTHFRPVLHLRVPDLELVLPLLERVDFLINPSHLVVGTCCWYVWLCFVRNLAVELIVVTAILVPLHIELLRHLRHSQVWRV